MNGITAVVLATGNDHRAIEAGAHAYAARSGRSGRRCDRLAMLGAQHLPTWCVRYTPPFFGLAAAVAFGLAKLISR